VAPALHSLIVCQRKDAARILEILFDSHVDIRKLILKRCNLSKNRTDVFNLLENRTDVLTTFVNLYPDLEVLSLEGCYPITSVGYSVIPRLKKLSELNLKDCEVR
jgi:hypothetical protein